MSSKFMHRLALFLLTCLGVALSTTAIAAASLKQPSAMATKNFWLLNNALSTYQSAAKQPWEFLPDYPHLLKEGKRSNVILLLREHLRLLGDLTPENDIGGNVFDDQLTDAVKNFQIRHGLKADGAVGDDTRTVLNISPEMRAKQMAINMQRWANLADKLGDRYIMVNIPDYHMYLVDNNQLMMSMRAIVGKPDLQTPELSSKVTRVIFNPYWNIPAKIAQRDIVPKMLDDPGYMYRMHIRAFQEEDRDNSQVDPGAINWHRAAMNGLNYHLRQDPGPENALGLVKFEFQNNHDVYMHDTPAKNLFDQGVRSLSHGCIRLENPFVLAEYLLKDNQDWNENYIQEVLDDGKTKYVKVPRPIPIFLTYITAWVDEAGRVNFRDDLYQLDETY